MRSLAWIISYTLHPLFLTSYMLVLVFLINPYLFSFQDPKSQGLLLISVFMLTTFFPLLSITLMRSLGLISSFEMADKRERIGPMIATSIFYLWLYLNIKDNNSIPSAFSFFVLGATIALFLSFFINVFHKISLHGVGVGGFLMGIFLIGGQFGYGSFMLSLGDFKTFQISIMLVYIVVILLAGATLTSRLMLGMHKKDEVYGGLMIGLASQLFAFLAVV